VAIPVRVVFATGNAGKLREVGELLAALPAAARSGVAPL
jgi:inosine/xanthosine triphosphate pyrophosphatase family protein